MKSSTHGGSLVERLQAQGDSYMLKIEEQRQRLLRLEEKTVEMTQKEETQKRENLQVSPKHSPRSVARRVKAQEDRLVMLTQALSNIHSTNAQLQQTINSRRLERHLLVKFVNKQDTELWTHKQNLDELLKSIENQGVLNDKVKATIEEVKEILKEEEDKHKSQVKTLVKSIDEDLLAARNAKITLEKRRKQGMLSNEVENTLKEANKVLKAKETKIKRRISIGAWKIAKQRAQLKLSSARIKRYETAFLKILSSKGFTDTNELVNTFVRVQKENFVLVEALNNLNTRVEDCNAEIQGLWKEIDGRRVITTQAESANQRIVREIEEKILGTQHRWSQYNKHYKGYEQVVKELKVLVPPLMSAFGILNGETTKPTSEWTDSELMRAVATIERRCGEIMELYSSLYLGDLHLDDTILSHLQKNAKKKQILTKQELINLERQITSENVPTHYLSRGEIEKELNNKLF
jgi:hypothetical protein